MARFSTDIRKEQIKEAALEIIYLDGISKFTTKRLAGKIGISEAAIFRHFSTKKEILLDILNDVETQLLASMKEIKQTKETAGVRLQKIVCHTIHYLVKNKGLSVLMLSEMAENCDPEIKCKVQSIFLGQRMIVEEIAVQGVEKGEIKSETDPHAFSLLYMGIPVGIQIELLINKSGFLEEGFCERTSKTFLQNYINSEFDISQNIKHAL
jgi:AcrR family transcriptional regulator